MVFGLMIFKRNKALASKGTVGESFVFALTKPRFIVVPTSQINSSTCRILALRPFRINGISLVLSTDLSIDIQHAGGLHEVLHLERDCDPR